MSKVIIIESCSVCPYFKLGDSYGGIQGKSVCSQKTKILLDNSKIPEWCELKELRSKNKIL